MAADGIEIYASRNVQACRLQAIGQTTGTAKKIDHFDKGRAING
jgi:hypothetical protein